MKMAKIDLFTPDQLTTAYPLQVLVVDDEAIILAELVAMLRAMGHTTQTATTVEVALRQLALQKPDLVMLDIYLGKGSTGFDLARQLDQQHISYLFMSAHSDGFTVESASHLNPLGYLVKPFTERHVFVKLELAAEKIQRPVQPIVESSLETVLLTSTLTEIEQLHIRTVLAKTRGRIRGAGGAAELLGVHPNTLQSRLDKLGIDKNQFS